MSLQRYELGTLMGLGADGTRHVARRGDGQFEVTILSGATTNPERWPTLVRRLHQVAMINHSSSVKIVEFDLDGDTPFIVCARDVSGSLHLNLDAARPAPTSVAAAICVELADVVAEAHRLGVTHGRLSPATVGWTEQNHVLVDFCGIQIDSMSPPIQGLERFSPPELASTDTADSTTDLFALGAILEWLRPVSAANAAITAELPRQATVPDLSLSPVEFALAAELDRLIVELKNFDPDRRPSARDVVKRLRPFLGDSSLRSPLQSTLADLSEASTGSPTADVPQQLGRFRIVEKLGAGGMGTVFKAIDTANGAVVAVKLLHPETANRPQALQRFRKEARMLAAVQSPFVANLLEVNEQDGVHYLVQEFVAGRSLRELLTERRRLDEDLALDITADVCRALTAAHDNGVIHRDIKPENILLSELGDGRFGVKVADFGLARQVEQTQSLEMTADRIVGTPLYMAPEQGRGTGHVDARVDIYSTGATLYHLLCGRPPFVADSPLAVLLAHVNEPLPAIRNFNQDVTEPVCRIVEQSLAKNPDDRFPSATTMLRELMRVRKGELAEQSLHPLIPMGDNQSIIRFEFQWELHASPQKVWPHVSNTERLNRAIGLPAVAFSTRKEGGRVRRYGSIRKLGIASTWQEHPFEWVEGRRFGVLREVEKGPFHWLVSIVELAPRGDGGTTLTHRFRIAPRGIFGKWIAALEVGFNARRNLDRVYRRIDAHLSESTDAPVDAFETPPALTRNQASRLRSGLDRLLTRGVSPQVVENLGVYLSESSAQDVSRIRPLAVAESLAFDSSQFVDACFWAVNEGLLVLVWDILCPVCRIPAQMIDTLREIRNHGRCDACNLDYELDFANSVELIFRAHPEVRTNELGTFCIGGPVHSPHVAAQIRVAANEEFELQLNLGEGRYKLRGPQLPYSVDFRVSSAGRVSRMELPLSRRPSSESMRIMTVGQQSIVLMNDTSQEILVRVERTAPRENALTAARATSLPLFRQLFPAERLSPGQLISIAQISLVATDLPGTAGRFSEMGDARSFALLQEHFRWLEEAARSEGGALVKTTAAGALLAFHDPLSATRTASLLASTIGNFTPELATSFRAAVHRGTALSATINDRIDYFGTTVSLVQEMLTVAHQSEIVLSSQIIGDAQVSEFLSSTRAHLVADSASLPSGKLVLQRLRIS